MDSRVIGAFLKRARQKAGKTQLEVAEAMGVMVQQVGRFESGKVEPMLSTIAGFARALGGTLELGIKPEPARQASKRRTSKKRKR